MMINQFIELKDTGIEIIDGDRGKNYPKNHEFFKLGYCLFLSTKNVTKNGFYFSDCQFISKEKDNKLGKGKLTINDIVITTRGTLGNVGFFDENINYKYIRINSGMLILRVNKDYDSYFIYSYLRSKLFKRQIQKFQSGSAQPQLPIKDFKYISIPIISISEQINISKFLRNLDQKIDLLRRQNETLEQIAQTLFKHWFVDFEFPDNNGLPYKSSGGEMVQSELGEIPAGWRIGKFSDEFKIIMGQSPPGESYNENEEGMIFFQGCTDFGFRFPSIRLYTSQPKRTANKFDILVSVRAPVGDVNVALDNCCIGRGLSAVSSECKSYCLYKVKLFKGIFNLFESEGTVFGALNKVNFHNIDSIIPKMNIIKKFERITNPFDDKIYNNELVLRNLIKIRELLLPKLMSGQIRIRN